MANGYEPDYPPLSSEEMATPTTSSLIPGGEPTFSEQPIFTLPDPGPVVAELDFGERINTYEPVEMTEYEAYENQFDFIPQVPTSNGVSSTTCKDYRLTEFGNYDNDGTFFPEHLSQQLNRYPSVDDNLRSKSGNFWTYGTTVDR